MSQEPHSFRDGSSQFEDEYNEIGVLDVNFHKENDTLLEAIEGAGFRLANYDDVMLEEILGNKQD